MQFYKYTMSHCLMGDCSWNSYLIEVHLKHHADWSWLGVVWLIFRTWKGSSLICIQRLSIQETRFDQWRPCEHTQDHDLCENNLVIVVCIQPYIFHMHGFQINPVFKFREMYWCSLTLQLSWFWPNLDDPFSRFREMYRCLLTLVLSEVKLVLFLHLDGVYLWS